MIDSEAEKFLDRFYRFYDGVIRKVDITYRNSPGTTCAEIEISARDAHSVPEGNWLNVLLKITGVSEFTFFEGHNVTYQVMSDGLYILQSDGLYFLTLGSSYPPENAEEYRESKFYLAGTDFEWSVRAYEEYQN